MSLIGTLITVLIVVGAIAFIIFIFFIKANNLDSKNKLEETGDFLWKNKYFRIVAGITTMAIFLIICLTGIHASMGRNEVRGKIEWISDHDYQMIINDTLVTRNDSLMKALMEIKNNTGNRPSNSELIYIKLIYKDVSIPLHLLRDSEQKTKYWVYYDAYESSSKNKIGEINTKTLNKYK